MLYFPYDTTRAREEDLEQLMKGIRSVGSLVSSTVLATIFMSLVTGSSYLAILVPGEIFAPAYDTFGLHRKNLSRTLEDAGTCVIPLVPWSAGGAYMASTLGVPTMEYLPWAIFCYTGFLFAILWGFTGFGISRLQNTKADGTQRTTI